MSVEIPKNIVEGCSLLCPHIIGALKKIEAMREYVENFRNSEYYIYYPREFFPCREYENATRYCSLDSLENFYYFSGNRNDDFGITDKVQNIILRDFAENSENMDNPIWYEIEPEDITSKIEITQGNGLLGKSYDSWRRLLEDMRDKNSLTYTLMKTKPTISKELVDAVEILQEMYPHIGLLSYYYVGLMSNFDTKEVKYDWDEYCENVLDIFRVEDYELVLLGSLKKLGKQTGIGPGMMRKILFGEKGLIYISGVNEGTLFSSPQASFILNRDQLNENNPARFSLLDWKKMSGRSKSSRK